MNSVGPTSTTGGSRHRCRSTARPEPVVLCSSAQLGVGLYKAWRAAGVPAGPAREVGSVAAVLAEAGSEVLAVAIPPDDFEPSRFGGPERIDGGWRFDPACAAVHGPSVIDLLLADPTRRIELVDLDCRALLEALVARAPADQGRRPAVDSARGSTVTVTMVPVDSAPRPLRSPAGPVAVDEWVWDRLSSSADRLLVPSSEASRLTGAGAGLVDND